MKIKRLQNFALRSNGKVIRVTKITRSASNSLNDLCMVSDVDGGKLVKDTSRLLLADSIRRRYNAL